MISKISSLILALFFISPSSWAECEMLPSLELKPPVPQQSLEEAMRSAHKVTHLKIKKEDLFCESGILYFNPLTKVDNRLKGGRQWERSGQLSFYVKDKEVFRSTLGVRIHGGVSRSAPDPSFRVYLRKKWGKKKIPKNVLFDGKAGALKRLVIHRNNEFINFITNPIVTKLGGEVPKYEPTLFFINETYMGIYFLSEHLHPKQWQRYLKKEDYYFVRTKSKYVESDSEYEGYKVYEKLKSDWIMTVPGQRLYKEAQLNFDIKNYMQHMFTFAFLGTTDWNQGAAVLDGVSKTNPQPPWKYVSWDLEHSIFDYAKIKKNKTIDLKRPSWAQESFELIMTEKRFHTNKPEKQTRKIKHQEIRRLLFHRLWMESKEFRFDFTNYATKALNRTLTQGYLDTLYVDSLSLSKSLTNDKISEYTELNSLLVNFKDFIKCRRQFIQQRLKEINKFPYRAWDGTKTASDHIDMYKFFKTYTKPVKCSLRFRGYSAIKV